MLMSVLLVNFLYIAIEFLTPLPTGTKTREIYVPQGATFRQAVEVLSKEKLTRDRNLFLLIGRMTGLHRKIRAGYYSITGSMNPMSVLLLLKRGQIVEYDITIVEGDSLVEIREKLAEKEIIDRETFMRLAKDKGFLEEYNIESPSVEGYIFPSTYKIPKGASPESALGMMINVMREKLSDALRERAEELGFSENKVLTLASIIEKEAVINSERPLISAVYHNRLKKRMPLQADPTSIYGVKSSKERITRKDLKRRTAYNTYAIKGLPPGPIASPGMKSIIAALYPANVPYIYFVSNNDGLHKFSVTASEHLSAVKEYREKKKRNKSAGKQRGKGIEKQKIDGKNIKAKNRKAANSK